ncbi:lactonase family protein [Acidocella aminolytica]|nr:lactonase family protein [Acidocella aminolytica]SHF61973.1 6-phosphogluconolactonase, cycloisomerase 2 family [Acidocella aminolytica 101 = DSM 11237]
MRPIKLAWARLRNNGRQMNLASTPSPMPQFAGECALYAFTGSFTTKKRKARGTGIGIYRLKEDMWQEAGGITGLINPSFLMSDLARGVIYAAHGDSDFASSFRLDQETGELRLLGQAATGGMNGVHLALTSSGRFLLVANYASGSVATLPVEPDGTLRSFIDQLELPGEPGPHRQEQHGSHPHHIVPDPSGRFFVVPDKGLDCVFTLAFDEVSARLRIVNRAMLRPGAGPRHIAFHPHEDVAFLVNELESSLVLCAWNSVAGNLTPLQQVSTLPEHFFGANSAAAIAITQCGRFVYVSNRGQDGIACFEYDSEAQRIAPLNHTTSGGRDPRFIILSPNGRQIIAANEQGDNLVFFDIDEADGTLIPRRATLHSYSPCTIAFLPT